MEQKTKFANLSLSAYAFGYGCGFVNDTRLEAKGFQNISLDQLNEIALKYGLGGVEVPVDKYFKEKDIEDFKTYINNLKDKKLRLIYALESFDYDFFVKIAPIIKINGGTFVRVKISNFYGGNRFKEESYKRDIDKFRSEISRAIKIIDQYDLRILIENHQDITLNDIFDLVDEFGISRIGINWDTGNSFPTGETVESFLSKSIHLIGNVHLKDYRVQTLPSGYIMHRCSLGKGIVNFEYLINTILKYNSQIPFTIELGAMNGREAMINNELYWVYTPGITVQEKNNLINFIQSKAENNNIISTLWERKASAEEIAVSELNEVIESIAYIKKILIDYNENNKE